MKVSDDAQVQAQMLIADRLGLDFKESRRADLVRGLTEAFELSGLDSPERYVMWLATLPDDNPEWRRLAGSLTVGETYFFRDRACMDALKQHLLPALIETRRSAGILRLRCWSAGCATGPEPYSLAILLDQLLPDRSAWALTVLATDINSIALETARQGLYSEWALRETPPWIVDHYFRLRRPNEYELDPAIRRMVTLAPLNLAKDSFPELLTNTEAMDLILCRNVLMYFTQQTQRAVVGRLHEALGTGGWLIVAPAEASIDLFRPLLPVSFPDAMFYRKSEDAATAPPFPSIEAPALELGDHLISTDEPVHPVQELPPVAPPAHQPAPSRQDRPSELRHARALADQGLLEQARRLCETLLAQDRLDPDTCLLLGAICQEQGQIPAAIEALRRAVYLAPDSAAAHYMLGCLLFRQGDRKRGRRSLEAVVKILQSSSPDQPVPGSDGLTAGRLLETSLAYMEMER